MKAVFRDAGAVAVINAELLAFLNGNAPPQPVSGSEKCYLYAESSPDARERLAFSNRMDDLVARQEVGKRIRIGSAYRSVTGQKHNDRNEPQDWQRPVARESHPIGLHSLQPFATGTILATCLRRASAIA